MWELLGTALERYGVGTAVMLAVILAAGIAIRELWKKNQDLGVLLRTQQEAESEKRKLMRDAFEKQMAEQRAEFDERTAEYIQHLNELQEKRIDFSTATTREVMGLASEIRDATRQQAETVRILRDTIVGGRS